MTFKLILKNQNKTLNMTLQLPVDMKKIIKKIYLVVLVTAKVFSVLKIIKLKWMKLKIKFNHIFNHLRF